MDAETAKAQIRAAAWALVAAVGANAAQHELERVKSEIGDSQWRTR